MPEKEHVVYEGPSRRDDSSGTIYVDGVRLDKGQPVEVDAELAKELLSGDSDRLRGHKFARVEESDAPAAKKLVATADTGGAGGSGGAGKTDSSPTPAVGR